MQTAKTDRVKIFGDSEYLVIVVVRNAQVHGPESQYPPANAKPQAATPSSPTEATDSVSAPPTSPSPSEPSYGFPAYPGKLSLKIGEAQSAGIELTSIAEAIQKLIDERKSGASNTSNAGSSND